jgi:hypothetical protein
MALDGIAKVIAEFGFNEPPIVESPIDADGTGVMGGSGRAPLKRRMLAAIW